MALLHPRRAADRGARHGGRGSAGVGRALGEFGATITFAGNFAGRTQTALAVYVALERDPDAAISLSLAMLVVSVVILGALRGRWVR